MVERVWNRAVEVVEMRVERERKARCRRVVMVWWMREGGFGAGGGRWWGSRLGRWRCPGLRFCGGARGWNKGGLMVVVGK